LYSLYPPPGGFFHHSSGKNERIQTKLGRKKLRHKDNSQENLGVYSMRGAPTRRNCDFFVCSYVASPFDLLRTEKTADFGVESRDPTANLCPSSKIPDFLRVGGGGIEKVRFSGFWGWVHVLSFGYSLYIEHQICTQKARGGQNVPFRLIAETDARSVGDSHPSCLTYFDFCDHS